ncbi:cation-translocating P-type ATPase [Streptomyces sp. NPDC053560]|uniref:cation-translocating P-type ATPase n=1 Tax=Streptomyces sp. NPDC053560 TaxID=3365711 RepID=UPI0037D96C41
MAGTEPIKAPVEETGPYAVNDVHHRESGEVAALLGVDPELGLSAAEAHRRLAAHGPNELAERARRPEWRKLLDQFRNWLIGILFGAAVLAGVIGEVKDAAVIASVLLINAFIGYWQEHRAEQSLDALRRMLTSTARVRRDGAERRVPAASLVPGDIVLLEAGDRVPADGRVSVARSAEAGEAALTGESQPVVKTEQPVAGVTAPLAERTSALFMNTVLTRGRAEMIVTGTGMHTEIGAIAEALRTGAEPRSPLEDQLDSLGRRLALVSGAAVALYAVVALVRGAALPDIALRAVALAVAAIPEGLPAVLALTLALGVYRMARRGAIVKKLAAVEALGSATVVCSDKTGTLTLNRMTARCLWFAGRLHQVPGEGSRTDHAAWGGTDERVPGLLHEAVRPFVLCNDARLTDDGIVGDPTEGALLVLAARLGLDTDRLRAQAPRTGEVPFDPAAKYMATYHQEDGGRTRVHIKGAMDVLLPRCDTVLAEAGPAPLDSGRRTEIESVLSELGSTGLRVMGAATAVVRSPPADVLGSGALTLVSFAGITDPPRPQARGAVDLCRSAGVAVKMITGDHAGTANAIAREVGIRGDVVTGAELDRLSAEELAARVDRIGVFARVAPDHKVSIVQALSAAGHIVAMTGDGVNDAAALRAAHIGVAMGRSGTDVAKEAADMVLADDDFSTIVRAVREGRAIYDNIVKFVRFQLSTNVGAILTLMAASAIGLPAPLTAVQLLWINIIMDGPPAMALGVDPAGSDVMRRAPRPPDERILDFGRLTAIVRAGVVMSVGTIVVLAAALRYIPEEAALTMAFTTFVLYQVANVFNARSERTSVFGRHQLRNRTLWLCLAAVVVIQVAAVEAPWLRTVFDTVPLTAGQWALCAAAASAVLLVEEVVRTGGAWLTKRRGSASPV